MGDIILSGNGPGGGGGGGSTTIVAPIGQQPMAGSVSVTIASDQSPISVLPGATFPVLETGFIGGGIVSALGIGPQLIINEGAGVCAIYCSDSGAFVGTIRVVGNVNGTLQILDKLYNCTDGTVDTELKLNKIYMVPCGGLEAVGVYATAYTSGSTNVELGAGTGSIEILDTITLGTNPGVNIGTVAVSNFPATQPVSGTVTANQGTPNTIANSWPVEMTDGTNILGTAAHPVRTDPTGATTQPISGAISFTAPQHVITDTGSTTAVTGNVTVVQPTGTNLHVVIDSGSSVSAAGSLTNNNAAPAANNMGVLPALANAANPTWIEGDQVLLSEDLSGNLRVKVNAPLPAGTNVIGHVITDTGSTTAVTGNVTVVQPTGTNLHVVVDSTTGTVAENLIQVAGVTLGATAVTAYGTPPAAANVPGVNAFITNTPAVTLASTTITGNVTVVQPTGTSLHTVVDSGTIVLGTSISLAPSAPTFATVGLASAQAVAANAARKGLILTNTSNKRISLGLGSAAVLNSGITLDPSGVFEMNPWTFYTGAVNAIASSASSNLAIQEYL